MYNERAVAFQKSGSGDLSAMASMMSSAAGTGSGEAAGTSGSAGDNDYFRKMQSMLTPEQIQLIRNIGNQQNT